MKLFYNNIAMNLTLSKEKWNFYFHKKIRNKSFWGKVWAINKNKI